MRRGGRRRQEEAGGSRRKQEETGGDRRRQEEQEEANYQQEAKNDIVAYKGSLPQLKINEGQRKATKSQSANQRSSRAVERLRPHRVTMKDVQQELTRAKEAK